MAAGVVEAAAFSAECGRCPADTSDTPAAASRAGGLAAPWLSEAAAVVAVRASSGAAEGGVGVVAGGEGVAGAVPPRALVASVVEGAAAVPSRLARPRLILPVVDAVRPASAPSRAEVDVAGDKAGALSALVAKGIAAASTVSGVRPLLSAGPACNSPSGAGVGRAAG